MAIDWCGASGNKPTNKAMINGVIVQYDGCSDNYNIDFYSPNHWEYLGHGIIWSCNEVKQKPSKKHFYRRI
jgi:hypothetical protein